MSQTPRARVLAAIGAALLLIALVVAGCGSSSSSSSTSSSTTSGESTTSEGTEGESKPTAQIPAEFPKYDSLAPKNFKAPSKPVKIAALAPETVLPVQQSYVKGWEEAAEKDNVELEIYDAGGFTNVAKQVSQMETAIANKPDAIILIPAVPTAFSSTIEEAHKQGIPVVGELLPPISKYTTWALVDSLEADGGYMVESIAKKTNEEGELFLINGAKGSSVDTLTTKGIKEAMAKYPKMKIVYESHLTSFDASGGQQVAESAVVKYPNVVGVLANSTTLGEGVAKALSDAGKSEVVISGIGPETPEQFSSVRSGKIAAAIAVPFVKASEIVMEWAAQIASGGAAPKEKLQVIEPMVVTTENVEQTVESGAIYQELAPSIAQCGPDYGGKQC